MAASSFNPNSASSLSDPQSTIGLQILLRNGTCQHPSPRPPSAAEAARTDPGHRRVDQETLPHPARRARHLPHPRAPRVLRRGADAQVPRPAAAGSAR